MKFVTLALATLLALGCHAASLQSDEPNASLVKAREGMSWALKQLGDSGRNVAAQISDPDTRQLFEGALSNLLLRIQSLRETTEPLTNSAVETLTEATADLRKKIEDDMTNLRAELDPQREALRNVINAHIEAYKQKLNTFIADYQEAQRVQMDTLKAKHPTLVADMQALISSNWEETKEKLMPVLSTLYNRLGGQVQNVREMVDPYAQEYKEQLVQAFAQAQAVDKTALAAKAQEHFAELKTCIEAVAAKVKEGMQ